MSMHRPPSIPAENTPERLQQLSEEVERIAATLSRLSLGPPKTVGHTADLDGRVPAASADIVKGVIKARRLRDRFFDAELFADPAWDILLELLHAEVSQYRVAVSSLCIAAHVPATTALRYIAAMTDSGLLRRQPDPNDGRRMFIELSPQTSDALHRYFASLKDASII